jgi:hypothetical protein
MQVHMPASASPPFSFFSSQQRKLESKGANEKRALAIKRSMRLGVQTVSREGWRLSFDSVSKKNAA